MKKLVPYMYLAGLLCAVLLITLSCSARKAESAGLVYGDVASGVNGFQAKSESSEMRSKDLAPAAPQPAISATATNGSAGNPVDATIARKLVRTASIVVRVQDIPASEAIVRKAIADAGGYVSSAYASEGRLQFELRVPQQMFDSMVEKISPLGKTESRSITAEDVTLRYYDLESRLETKRVLAETFRGYLRNAKTIEDILAVETRLADLQNEIDQTGGEFRNLANLVDFATIHLSLLLPDADMPDTAPGLGERLRGLLRGFVSFVQIVITIIVGLVVYGVPLVLLGAGLWWLLFGKAGLLLKLFRKISR